MTSCHTVKGLHTNEKKVNLYVFHNPLVDLSVPLTIQVGNIDKMFRDSGRHYKYQFTRGQMSLPKSSVVNH